MKLRFWLTALAFLTLGCAEETSTPGTQPTPGSPSEQDAQTGEPESDAGEATPGDTAADGESGDSETESAEIGDSETDSDVSSGDSETDSEILDPPFGKWSFLVGLNNLESLFSKVNF